MCRVCVHGFPRVFSVPKKVHHLALCVFCVFVPFCISASRMQDPRVNEKQKYKGVWLIGIQILIEYTCLSIMSVSSACDLSRVYSVPKKDASCHVQCVWQFRLLCTSARKQKHKRVLTCSAFGTLILLELTLRIRVFDRSCFYLLTCVFFSKQKNGNVRYSEHKKAHFFV